MVALLLVPAILLADQDLRASLDEAAALSEDITAAVVTDSDHSESPFMEKGSNFRDILAPSESDIPDVGASEMTNILDGARGLEAINIYDLDVTPQPASTAATVPGVSKTAGLPDMLVPSLLLLLGTALTTFAFFTRRTQNHSRRAYFSRHFFIARPPSRSRSLRTSRSAGSSAPSPSENTGHSLPRKRLA